MKGDTRLALACTRGACTQLHTFHQANTGCTRAFHLTQEPTISHISATPAAGAASVPQPARQLAAAAGGAAHGRKLFASPDMQAKADRAPARVEAGNAAGAGLAAPDMGVVGGGAVNIEADILAAAGAAAEGGGIGGEKARPRARPRPAASDVSGEAGGAVAAGSESQGGEGGEQQVDGEQEGCGATLSPQLGGAAAGGKKRGREVGAGEAEEEGYGSPHTDDEDGPQHLTPEEVVSCGLS